MSEGDDAAARAELRADLAMSVIHDPDTGRVAVVVADPVRGRYFKFEWPESALVLAWHACREASRVATTAEGMFGVAVARADVEDVVAFARANHLVVATQGAAWRGLAVEAARQRQSLPARLLHNYLFFRVPLTRPDAALRLLVPRLGWLFAVPFWVLVALTALAGLYLASRQMDSVDAALAATLTLQAWPAYGVAILGLKAIHELGHALTAARLGCRVPSMGVAVMLGAPVLYTDVSDSWRLARRADRLKVVFAGVAAEAVVAAIALLAWSVLPDGTARHLCFAVATSAIVLSLLVNLNPLMRFDGYFALSDWWRVPNLQARAFDLGLWSLRETLFALGRPPPETVGRSLHVKLVAYAASVAIYRLFLFLGIAAILLYVAGKAVGLVLAAVEIGVFIIVPIVREFMEWWKMRREILARSRAIKSGAVVVALLALALTPWMGRIAAPAVIVAAREEALHLAHPARLTEVAVVDGQDVRRGDILFRAWAPDLERDLVKARIELALVRQQADRWHASDRERDVRLVVESRLAAATEKLAGIERRLAQLTVRAPFDGRLVDLDPVAVPGQWFGRSSPLARLVDGRGVRARAVLADADLARVQEGASAVFVADDPTRRAVMLELTALQPASDGRLAEPALAERHGGSIATGGPRGDLLARQGGFEATLTGADKGPPHLVRGVVQIDATRVSPARLLWSSIARVLVREQGF